MERTRAGLVSQPLDGQVFVVRHLRWKGAASSVLFSRSRAMPVWRPAVPCPTASAGSQRRAETQNTQESLVKSVR